MNKRRSHKLLFFTQIRIWKIRNRNFRFLNNLRKLFQNCDRNSELSIIIQILNMLEFNVFQLEIEIEVDSIPKYVRIKVKNFNFNMFKIEVYSRFTIDLCLIFVNPALGKGQASLLKQKKINSTVIADQVSDLFYSFDFLQVRRGQALHIKPSLCRFRTFCQSSN